MIIQSDSSILHRRNKRQLEMRIIIKEIVNFLKSNKKIEKEKRSILEFGSGRGYQLPYLMNLGDVVASDIIIRPEVHKIIGNKFVECSIADTPFDNNQFNIIFSNHVIEHIDSLTKALRETQRIGTSSCLYAFSVPTNIWLLLSIPAQYYNKLRNIIQLFSLMFNISRKTERNLVKSNVVEKFQRLSLLAKIKYFIRPQGHGTVTNFIDCYRSFRINRWKQLFIENGFSIIKITPLLLYGPSEWPIIKPKICKTNFCSSVLFLLKKKS